MGRYPEPHFMCPEQLKNKSSDTELTHSTAVRYLVNADTLVLLLIPLFSLTLSLFPTSLLPAPDWSPCPRGPTALFRLYCFLVVSNLDFTRAPSSSDEFTLASGFFPSHVDSCAMAPLQGL